MLAIEKIRELLDYNPDTGVFTWIEREVRPWPLARIDKNWNARFAGKQVPTYVAGTTGYAQICILNVRYNAHRIAWAHFHGENAPKGIHIDHINGVRTDNRIANLRLATPSQNVSNSARHKDGTSGYKGVSFHKAAQKWHARICVDYKTINLGLYPTAEEAYAAYVQASQRFRGEFSHHLNRGPEDLGSEAS